MPFWAPRVFGIFLELIGLGLARPFRGPFLGTRGGKGFPVLPLKSLFEGSKIFGRVRSLARFPPPHTVAYTLHPPPYHGPTKQARNKKRDRDYDSQPRPQPRLNSQRQGATKHKGRFPKTEANLKVASLNLVVFILPQDLCILSRNVETFVRATHLFQSFEAQGSCRGDASVCFSLRETRHPMPENGLQIDPFWSKIAEKRSPRTRPLPNFELKLKPVFSLRATRKRKF